jgi:hypothetical protein
MCGACHGATPWQENRLNGRVARVDLRANGHKLTLTEEQALISMDNWGYAPQVSTVRGAARLLFQERVRSSPSIGPTKFIKGTPILQSQFNCKYNYQRAQCKDPVIIEAWFQLVRNMIGKYGIQEEDIFNFDKTGFSIGIASTSRVVTASDWQGKPPQLQPGDREWVTSIETINARGWYLPPMVIFKGKVHLSTWFETTGLPSKLGNCLEQ